MSLLPFHRHKTKLNRNRAASTGDKEGFILNIGAQYLAERFEDMERKPRSILEIGGYHGQLKKRLSLRFPNADYVQTDLSLPLLRLNSGKRVVVDEEFLPFAPGSFDLIVSNLTLHWINDLPGALWQIQQTLAPNGLFIANLFGTKTLHELKHVMMQEELALYQRASSRISPFIDTKMGGELLQRAGFELPIADSDILTVMYPSPFQLFEDLRHAGQRSAFKMPSPYMGQKLLSAVCYEYNKLFPSAQKDGIDATFELIHLTGIQKVSC